MSNYPPGTYQADPRAPWNAPDSWEGAMCRDCKHLKEASTVTGSKTYICTQDLDDLFEVSSRSRACEGFER